MMGSEGMAKYRVSNDLVTFCRGYHQEGALCGLRPSISQRTSVSAGPHQWALDSAMSLMERDSQKKHPYKTAEDVMHMGNRGTKSFIAG